MVIARIDVKDHFPDITYKPLPYPKAISATAFDAYCLQGMLKSETIAQHFEPSPGTFLPRTISRSAAPIAPSTSAPLPETQQSSVRPSPTQKFSAQRDLPLDAKDFIRSIWPYAVQAASLIGIDPKILIAQAALETGWGRSIAQDATGNSNNLFNIKAQTGDAVRVQTTEYVGGSPVPMRAAFRKYPSVAHCFADYVAFIHDNPRYQTALSSARDPARYVQALQQAGYASDPNYAEKILSIYHGRVLNSVFTAS